MAVLLAAGAHAVASHTSAAALWGFRNVHREAIEITTLRAERCRLPGVRAHRATELPKEDVAERDGIPVTSYERTLCDMTTQLFPTQLGRILDDGLRQGMAGLVALHRCADRLRAGPNRRLAVIDDLLATRSDHYDPGGSASELRVLQVIRDAGLPEPVQQYRVEVGGRTFFLDYAYPEQRVMIEYYGLAVHGTSSAVARDSRRVSLLVCDGWRPLPFTDESADREIVSAVTAILATPPRR
jgi:very-short-patch-repair endonuclease